jgi:iron-sulfur cluster repair protein YtfE (RIC family)
MLASHLVEVNELSAPLLCTYIETKHYIPIKQSLEVLASYAEDLQNRPDDAATFELCGLLFYKMKGEVEQMIRNDHLILFPMIRKEYEEDNPVKRKLPLEMIQSKNRKILSLMERMRQIANNYIAKPNWSQHVRLFFEEMFGLEQIIQQAIYLKENVLLRKMSA